VYKITRVHTLLVRRLSTMVEPPRIPIDQINSLFQVAFDADDAAKHMSHKHIVFKLKFYINGTPPSIVMRSHNIYKKQSSPETGPIGTWQMVNTKLAKFKADCESLRFDHDIEAVFYIKFGTYVKCGTYINAFRNTYKCSIPMSAVLRKRKNRGLRTKNRGLRTNRGLLNRGLRINQVF
jgi:hypothetical protein